MFSLNDPPPADPKDASLTGSAATFKPIEASPPIPRWPTETIEFPAVQVVKVKFGSIFWPIVSAWFFCGVVSAILYELLK